MRVRAAYYDRNVRARVAKSADAKDLKSFFAQAECGFKSRPGHHCFSGLQEIWLCSRFVTAPGIAPAVSHSSAILTQPVLSVFACQVDVLIAVAMLF